MRQISESNSDATSTIAERTLVTVPFAEFQKSCFRVRARLNPNSVSVNRSGGVFSVKKTPRGRRRKCNYLYLLSNVARYEIRL